MVTPNGHCVDIREFFTTLKITTKRDIGNAHDFGEHIYTKKFLY